MTVQLQESPTGTGARVPARRRPGRRPKRSTASPGGLPYGLLTPALVIVAAVSVVPIGYAFWLSFQDTQFARVTGFAGLSHYAEIFSTQQGWADIGRTLLYVVTSLLVAIPLGLGLAVLLNRPVRFRAAFRTMILMPWVISQTIAALLWRWLLDPSYGPLPLGSLDPLAEATTAMAALVLVNVWISYPFATVLCLAALQTVPKELLEAGEMDGTSRTQRFRLIVLPLLRPTLLVLVIMLTLLYFNMVTLVYTLTGGGPFSGTQVLSLNAFLQSFQFFRLGLGAAYSVVLFIFNVIFGIAYVRLIRSDPHA